jgi:hypothetical protein
MRKHNHIVHVKLKSIEEKLLEERYYIFFRVLQTRRKKLIKVDMTFFRKKDLPKPGEIFVARYRHYYRIPGIRTSQTWALEILDPPFEGYHLIQEKPKHRRNDSYAEGVNGITLKTPRARKYETMIGDGEEKSCKKTVHDNSLSLGTGFLLETDEDKERVNRREKTLSNKDVIDGDEICID